MGRSRGQKRLTRHSSRPPNRLFAHSSLPRGGGLMRRESLLLGTEETRSSDLLKARLPRCSALELRLWFPFFGRADCRADRACGKFKQLLPLRLAALLRAAVMMRGFWGKFGRAAVGGRLESVVLSSNWLPLRLAAPASAAGDDPRACRG